MDTDALFEPIAIIGLAARLPGAWDADEYWRNLVDGRESLTELTDSELRAAGVPAARLADAAYVRMAGLIPGVDQFDADFFGMTAREAEVCDPQLRIFLELVYLAVEDAGYDPQRMSREVAVYGACGPSRYGDLHVLADPAYAAAPDMGITVLNNIDYLSTLASYKLDFRGPSMSVLTACSSSLTAVSLACRSLQLGECDLAIAGASNVEMPYRAGYRWSPGDVRSADGHCRPFDAAGSGTIFTSGAATVLLKRLSDAIVDGDRVRAVIRGIGITNDGSDKVSFSAPSVAGQATAIVDAMMMAGVTPHDISFVEMHATGTPLGDPIEMAALTRAYRRLAREPIAAQSIPVGSVKANIGHTNPTAGLAGLAKLVLSLENEQIPRAINVTAVNPRLEIGGTPFVINEALARWPRTDGRPRRAGLTSLGVGGTNVHLVLEEGPVPDYSPHLGRPRVVIWSGRGQAAAAAGQSRLAEHFATSADLTFADEVATLQQGRAAHAVRGAVVCASPAEAAESLASAAAANRVHGTAEETPPGVVFAFPGQGAQHARMAAELYGRQRVFTETVDLCLDGFRQQGLDLYPVWLDPDAGADLHRTVNAQPLLFAIEYALARQWTDWGIRPLAVIGHSIGELVAATVAGVFELDDALRLVARRGQIMQRQPPGGMLTTACGPERVRPLLPPNVTVAAVNAADQTVLAGPDADLAVVSGRLSSVGVATRRLNTSHAFHAPAMRAAADEFAACFAGVRLRAADTPLYSAASGARLTDEQAVDPDFWARQVAEPVLFAQAAEAALASAGDASLIALEVGPGAALTGLIRRHPAARAGRCDALPSLDRHAGEPVTDERDLLEALATLWVRGCVIDWPRIYLDEPWQHVGVPGYQFQRRRHWVDPPQGDAISPPGPAKPTARQPAPAPSPQFARPGWDELIAETPPARADGHPRDTALVLAPEAGQSPTADVVDALARSGYTVTAVRLGSEFAARSGGFTVRQDCLADDLSRVVAATGPATVLVHAWAAEPVPANPASQPDVGQLERTFYPLLDLVKSAGRAPLAGKLPSLLVLTRGAFDVSGDEAVVPSRAALAAAARAFRLESPDTECRVIDLGNSVSAQELAHEVRSGTAPVVAMRGQRRWAPCLRPWAPPRSEQAPLRPAGVYVITGGLGGIGVALARGLAATGYRPRMALLGRSVSDHGLILEEIERTSASVTVIKCDVADPEQLGPALDQVAAEFGPVNGVFHLAGVAGDRMLHFRSARDAERVLRPKVAGTVTLAQALAGHPSLDFVVCFSSRAALTGMIGGADYAAANAFMDAYARYQPRWLTVNWPVWSGTGMAAAGVVESLAPPPPTRSRSGGPSADSDLAYEATFAAQSHWELDEHRVAGTAVLPGTALTDLIIRAYLATVEGAAAPVTLRDLAFVRPLSGDAARQVRVVFKAGRDGSWQVGVYSRAADRGDADGWLEHASCLLMPEGGPPPGAIDLGELTGAAASVNSPASRSSAPSDLLLGPHWQSIQRIWESGAVTVAELALPRAFADEAAGYAVHPALLDAGTGMLRRGHEGLLVPFIYRKMTWYGPLPPRIWSVIRAKPGDEVAADIAITDADGRQWVTIEGFTLRRIDPSDFADGPRDERPQPGLLPEDGIRMLLELLSSRYAGQVAVTAGDPTAQTPVSGTLEAAEPAPARSDTAGEAEGSVLVRLGRIWRDVLGCEMVGPEDDFFALGGDSLLAVALTGRIRDAFDIELSIGLLLDFPTLGEMADALRDLGAR